MTELARLIQKKKMADLQSLLNRFNNDKLKPDHLPESVWKAMSVLRLTLNSELKD